MKKGKGNFLLPSTLIVLKQKFITDTFTNKNECLKAIFSFKKNSHFDIPEYIRSFKHYSLSEKHLGTKFIQGTETISYYQTWKKLGNTLKLVTYDSPSLFISAILAYILLLLSTEWNVTARIPNIVHMLHMCMCCYITNVMRDKHNYCFNKCPYMQDVHSTVIFYKVTLGSYLIRHKWTA
jgi:hypothetical protein